MKLEEEELEAHKMEVSFKSLQEELDFKTEKLTSLFDNLQGANREL